MPDFHSENETLDSTLRQNVHQLTWKIPITLYPVNKYPDIQISISYPVNKLFKILMIKASFYLHQTGYVMDQENLQNWWNQP